MIGGFTRAFGTRYGDWLVEFRLFLAANHLGLSKRRNKVGLEKIVIGKKLYVVATRSFQFRIRVRRPDRLVGLNHVPNR